MKLQSVVLAMAIAAGFISGACGSSSPSGTAGSTGSGGVVNSAGSSGGAVVAGGNLGAGGAGAACANGTPCGGNVVGTWTVSSSCLKVSGNLDLALAGAGCPTAPITGSLQVTGTWTANADGTYTDNTITSGDEQFTLAPSCLLISSTPVTCDGAASIIKNLGFASLTCTAAASGGCGCAGTVHQSGGIGLVSVAPSSSGNYTTSGSAITLSGDSGDSAASYCVSGNQLTWTPQSTSPTLTGTIGLQSGGTTGTGGTSGVGGATNTGGTSASGAPNASGGTGGASATGGAGTAGGPSGMAGAAGAGSTTGPCDIYKTGGTPCVAAHSTVRALFGGYSGKLYQVRNAGGTTLDIGVRTGGIADAAAQDTFCSGTTCVITIIYDQTGKANDLYYQGSDSKVGGKDKPASATGETVKLGGNKVYSLYINAGNSYWVDGSKNGMPLGASPEGMYMVTSGTHSNSGCCFDYGNSETDRKYDGPGTMDALNFSSITSWGTGAGSGPWVLADLEAGLFAMGGSGKNPSVPTMTNAFVTAVLKNNGTSEFALRGSDATAGNLATFYKGALPGGWSPMKKQGAIVLGSGGDCCATNMNLSAGTFYEGSIVSGYPTDATENAVQANIVAAGYSK